MQPGRKHVLVLCDYATRYPEAIPLSTIDATTIAEELVKVFARVGVPSSQIKGVSLCHSSWPRSTDCCTSNPSERSPTDRWVG